MVSDRHGRAARADNDPRRRPSDGFRAVTAQRFRRLVDAIVAGLPQRYAAPLTGATIVVEDLPPPPLVDREGEVLLARFDHGRLTVYRRPLEMRAESRQMLEDATMVAIAQAVARSLGFDDDIEGLFD
jgi:predicted Zn-dependent protease with MMP-like domain